MHIVYPVAPKMNGNLSPATVTQAGGMRAARIAHHIPLRMIRSIPRSRSLLGVRPGDRA